MVSFKFIILKRIDFPRKLDDDPIIEASHFERYSVGNAKA